MVLGQEWNSVDSVLPPMNDQIRFSTGSYEFDGYMDHNMDVYEVVGSDRVYHSKVDDGYITHWKD